MHLRLSVLLVLLCVKVKGQQADTASLLHTVEVKAYFTKQPVLSLPASVSVLSAGMLAEQQPFSLVPAMNSVPGMRMEERSPGSYRLSIRGSLLRSPFGIRNVKMYMDDFLLTDAGGNTYLNAIDASAASEIAILKGPEGSVYGANTGGVVLINTEAAGSETVEAAINGGSYGLLYQNASIQKKWNDVSLSVYQAYQRSDGYRENSAMNRKYIQALPQWSYSSNGSLKALLVYSDMHYETPGGLTAGQMESNPRSARPAAGPNPGAREQQAGIYNKTFLGGLMHEVTFKPSFKHVLAITGSLTDFRNPFITNYEVREERTAGLRTYFQYTGTAVPLTWQLGYEGQRTLSDISNYDNNGGIRGNTQSADQLNANQQFVFSRLSIQASSRLLLEAAASINFNGYKYGAIDAARSALNDKAFDAQVMPRIAASYKLSEELAVRASTSRGFSSPTIAEVRASDQVINTELQPESGWNYEAGLRMSLANNRLYWDAVVFRYDLKNAIVRRVNEDDAEYFVNAGGTNQSGLESQLLYWLVPPRKQGFLRSTQLRNSYTYSDFSFDNYQSGSEDYTGNRLTGIPKHVLVSSVNLGFAKQYSLFLQHNYTSDITLNDASSVYAEKYHLLQAKASRKFTTAGGLGISFYIGADNLLDETYSLGNDLNAFGNRYFNPAARRNFFAGLSVEL
ncbi:iron complex outermembrane receptor protein [Arcticibacter pallidicorallinus]|uniref:Iron complex outermembrane receptor protein n=1 Tax=Arcticibacter pallidicorallinus TaxID=1259464 RepID=A0A2T0TW04_9SPHI|nr:TonB-dependent receptor [Arcticibacter pallidicorallinus]PRY49841.1 iron complex outermembrane receptor protein [Arcticibacter pallidicorallinus]